jgi:hypothetical protein
MNSTITQLEEFDQCTLKFLSIPMKEYKTLFFLCPTIGHEPNSKIWNNVANWTFFLSIPKQSCLLTCYKIIKGDNMVENMA